MICMSNVSMNTASRTTSAPGCAEASFACEFFKHKGTAIVAVSLLILGWRLFAWAAVVFLLFGLYFGAVIH